MLTLLTVNRLPVPLAHPLLLLLLLLPLLLLLTGAFKDCAWPDVLDCVAALAAD